MLASATHQHESATGIRMSPLPWSPLSFLSLSHPFRGITEHQVELPLLPSKFSLAFYFTRGTNLNAFFFYSWVIFHCAYLPRFLYPCMCWWVSRLFLTIKKKVLQWTLGSMHLLFYVSQNMSLKNKDILKKLKKKMWKDIDASWMKLKEIMLSEISCHKR